MPIATPGQYLRMLDVLVALHTDHCPPDRVDSFIRPMLAESARRRLEGRAPLSHSHMFDGSSLPLADNFAIALLQRHPAVSPHRPSGAGDA